MGSDTLRTDLHTVSEQTQMPGAPAVAGRRPLRGRLGLRKASPPAHQVGGAAPPKGFEQAKAPSARAAKLTRIGFRCVLGLKIGRAHV